MPTKKLSFFEFCSSECLDLMHTDVLKFMQAIKLLLVAHTNHSRLKHNVHMHLIDFGQQFGIINQLMNSLPTQKMVEAVSEAYAAFSKFLAKCVKYYKESKLTSAVRALGFPWETRFQLLVTQIQHAFHRVRDLAQAGHFGITVQSQHMLRTISVDQENMRLEMRQDSLDLRKQLKDELKGEVQALFESFDRNWIQRFEQIMITAGSAAQQQALPGAAPVAAIEYADSLTIEPPPIADKSPATFLADHVSKPKRLRRFRDHCFPLLRGIDGDDIALKARLKHLKVEDLQQCVGLLQSEDVRQWLQASESALLWVNTHRIFGQADWASAFATKIIEHAGKFQDMTILYHFCGNHKKSDPISSACVVVQSLIMQLLEHHHKQFSRKAFPFTMEHFQDAQDDFDELWNIFNECCWESKATRIWIVIDNIDNLQDSDQTLLPSALRSLTNEQSRIFKAFVTARSKSRADTLQAIDMDDKTVNSPHLAIVNVPRAQSRAAGIGYGRQRRRSKVPEVIPEHESEVEKPDIQGLLQSSDEESSDVDPEALHSFVQSPTSIKSLEKSFDKEDGDESGLSDSSLEFARNDPFASSDESDWEKNSESDTLETPSKGFGESDEEDDEEFELINKAKDTKPPSHTDFQASSDDENTNPALKVRSSPNDLRDGKPAKQGARDKDSEWNLSESDGDDFP